MATSITAIKPLIPTEWIETPLEELCALTVAEAAAVIPLPVALMETEAGF